MREYMHHHVAGRQTAAGLAPRQLHVLDHREHPLFIKIALRLSAQPAWRPERVVDHCAATGM